jgi:hypothetical protein
MADLPTDSHYDELDRLAARSLAAREGSAQPAARSRRTLLPWAIAGLLFVFLLGLVGSPLFERSVRGALPPALQADQGAEPDPRIDGLTERVAKLEAERARSANGDAVPIADVTGLGTRLQAVESRAMAAETNDSNLLARVDALAAEVARTSSAVVETDARTRDLFLLSVARRMLEAGRPLTPIEPVIADRFAKSDAAAVEALGAWSRAPQTRSTLKSRLAAIGELPSAGEAGGWWERLKARLAGLVTVRGERVETADGAALMAEARTAMAAGDLELAASALSEGDWPPAVRQWVADARILLAAEESLGRLETAALEAGIGAARSQPAP